MNRVGERWHSSRPKLIAAPVEHQVKPLAWRSSVKRLRSPRGSSQYRASGGRSSPIIFKIKKGFSGETLEHQVKDSDTIDDLKHHITKAWKVLPFLQILLHDVEPLPGTQRLHSLVEQVTVPPPVVLTLVVRDMESKEDIDIIREAAGKHAEVAVTKLKDIFLRADVIRYSWQMAAGRCLIQIAESRGSELKDARRRVINSEELWTRKEDLDFTKEMTIALGDAMLRMRQDELEHDMLVRRTEHWHGKVRRNARWILKKKNKSALRHQQKSARQECNHSGGR